VRSLIVLAVMIGLPLVALFGFAPTESILDRAVEVWDQRTRDGLSQSEIELAEAPVYRREVDATSSRAAPPRHASSEKNSQASSEIEGQSGSQPVGNPAVENVSASATNVAPLVSKASQMADLEQRLRDAGASSYTLQRWGGQQAYRFECNIIVGGIRHYFAAIDEDPLKAMGNVLSQVERWRLRSSLAQSTAR